ncbi:MAG: hypothetical protein NWE79_00115 [Candidatus Bathyarchaeota archaeon]|nr:hypothetical protein [Candidatus Bathyarchaeota archaeon]
MASRPPAFSRRIGRSGGGADTAIVVKPMNAYAFFDMRRLEIICKPRG